MAKQKRIGVEVFLTQTQQTLDTWIQKLTTALDLKKKEQEERQKLEAKKQEIIALILQLHESGATIREIENILGKENISHATIHRYIKLAKKAKEQTPNA